MVSMMVYAMLLSWPVILLTFIFQTFDPMDTVSVVKTNMTATQAGINPEATTSGITLQVRVFYNLQL